MRYTALQRKMHRHSRRLLVHSSLIAFSCLLVPALANAQAYGPGDLAIAALPALNAPGVGAVPGNTPSFQVNFNGDLSERYVTNALGTSQSNIPGYDTRALLGVNASEQSARINATFSYIGGVDYFAGHFSQQPVFSNYLNSNAVFAVMPDHFLFSTYLFAEPVYGSQLGNVAPIGETLPPGANNELTDTYGFSLQPDLFFRLGDFLRSDLLPAYNAVYFTQPTGAGGILAGENPVPESATTEAVTEKLTSGNDFTRLQWAAIASYSQMNEATGGLTQRSVTGELSYAITNDISVLANGGYQTVTANSTLLSPVSGPIMLAGLRFNLPRLTGQFLVGEQYRSFSGVGHLAYQITPRISLQADASDNVTTPGAALLNSGSLLSGITQGLASGQFQPLASGAFPLSQLTSIGLQNSIVRIRTALITFQYVYDNLTFTTVGFATKQSALTSNLLGQNQNLQSVGFTPSLSYGLSPDLTVGADLVYQDQTQLVGHDTSTEYDIYANYALSDKTNLYLQGAYYQRFSDQALSRFSSNRGDVSIASIRLGINHHF